MLALLNCPLLFSIWNTPQSVHIFLCLLECYCIFVCLWLSFVRPFLRGRKCSVAVPLHHYYVIECVL